MQPLARTELQPELARVYYAGPAPAVHEREREGPLSAGSATDNANQARAHGLRVKDFIAVRRP